MYIIEVVDKASGTVRYISRISRQYKRKKALDMFDTTKDRKKVSNSATFKSIAEAEKARDIAMQNKEYWNKIYNSYIINKEVD